MKKIVEKTKARATLFVAAGFIKTAGSGRKSGFRLILQHLTAAIDAGWADVVTQMDFTSGRLDSDARHIQCIVRTMHAALRGGFFVLLNSHDGS
jgi:hypothetical protein